MIDENSNHAVTRSPASSAEIAPVTEDLYTDMTLEELERRLELQALLDGDLGAEGCYVEYVENECTCHGDGSITTITLTTVTVTTRPN